MKVSFGFSPCPNDTFMFEAIVNNRIDLQGLDFECTLLDVEQLNKAAFELEYDITKLSFNAYTRLYQHYILLESGSALGNNCGPLLIAKADQSIEDAGKMTIAIPGINTTAYLLLKFAFGNTINVVEMLFSEIEDAVLLGKVDAGVIIHENRFTYHLKGLKCLMDLGAFWEETNDCPIPLGAIAIRRSFPKEIQSRINRVIHDSIQYAFEHPTSVMNYVSKHAQEMSPKVIKSHIDLYVTEQSKKINQYGIKAIHTLFESQYQKEDTWKSMNLIVTE